MLSVQDAISSGSLLVAVPIVIAAGVVSCFSPGVLPLLPGYLCYLAGTGADEGDQDNWPRLLLGAFLLTAAFTVVFVTSGVLVIDFGVGLLERRGGVERVLGGLTIALGLAWGAGLRRRTGSALPLNPWIALVAGPTLGAALALEWAPVVGPTLGAVMALGVGGQSDVRGGVLAVAYCLGVGLPFLALAFACGRVPTIVAWRRRHRVTLVSVGAAVTTALGVFLVAGSWSDVVAPLQVWVNGFTPVL